MRFLIRSILVVIAVIVGAVFYYGGPRALKNVVPKNIAPAAVGDRINGADFAAERAQFKTAIELVSEDTSAAPAPPDNIFQKITYPSAVGPLGAYLTPDPKDKQKHPAIIWITGGDCNSIGEMWLPADPKNDQTAAAFRKAGIVMMAPSLRGGNDNPGKKQGFAGEIDDIIAAADFLAKQPYVDPARIYLGGHSTGGTLVLLTAEASDRFRAIFSFGPLHQARYHRQFAKVDFSKLDAKEVLFRSPENWLASVRKPLFVLEGAESPSNIEPMIRMRQKSSNPNITFLAVKGATHFTILAPITAAIAQKIMQDNGQVSNIQLSEAELAKAFEAK